MMETEEFIKAFYDKDRGWRLFLPDGTEIPSLTRASVTIDDNWDVKPFPSVNVSAPCEIVTEMPKKVA